MMSSSRETIHGSLFVFLPNAYDQGDLLISRFNLIVKELFKIDILRIHETFNQQQVEWSSLRLWW